MRSDVNASTREWEYWYIRVTSTISVQTFCIDSIQKHMEYKISDAMFLFTKITRGEEQIIAKM